MHIQRRGGTLNVRVGRAPPLELHWTLLIGMLLFGGGTAGGAIGFFVIVLAHELGHAYLVRARGLHAISISMHWMGGACRYDAGWATPLDRAIIAWGGVLAQGAILVAALVLGRTLGPGSGFAADLLSVLIVSNAMIIVLNLLPIAGLDGATAWTLPSLLARRRQRARREDEHAALRRELDAIERRKRDDPTLH